MAPKTERFEMRLETTMIERVDAWRRKQEDLPSRAEAFRRLIFGKENWREGENLSRAARIVGSRVKASVMSAVP
jgi:metal-responsive CopG/Arc/MetJ family transcriptional regulator